MTTTTTQTIQVQDIQKNKCADSTPHVDMGNVAAIILGGGEGTRLFPLTTTHCKPAICFGGRYRLIDVPLSNSINSGCLKNFIVTQYLSTPLHQHIISTYRMGSCTNGFVEILTAEQKPKSKSWFQGTADAVRQNLEYIKATPVEYFLILAGDQLYNFNFKKMVAFAQETGADVTIAALPVAEAEAKRMGVLKVNEDSCVTEFHEKPQKKELLDHMKLPNFLLERIKPWCDENRQYIGSMGIYLFKREALLELLECDPREDFGKHLLPTKVQQGRASAYLFDGYWEDIGTIESFYHANMALTKSNSEFCFYDESSPIFSHHYNLPPSKINVTYIEKSILCEGTIVEADEIRNSILGPRTVVKQGTIIKNSYLMGNDFYTMPKMLSKDSAKLSIGENCLIDKTIIDKNVIIGNGVQLVNKNKLANYDGDRVYIRDGIIVVASGACLPDGFVL
jgi:glucose-1-phosphate adenylyltransferase